MKFDSSIARDVDAGILAWRVRVLRILLAFSSAALLVPLGVVVSGRGVSLPVPLPAVFAAFYLLLLGATLRPRWPYGLRSGLLLGLIGTMGAIRLAVGRLEGSGRITLLLLPLLALLLAGPRAGWTAVAVAVGLYAAVPWLLRSGALAGLGAAWTEPDLSLAFWGMQGAFWLIVLLTLMILFTRFQARQRDTMIAERVARRQREAAAADRQRLEAEIVRIGEAERRRLGAELHDGLCQHLTAALLNCSAMEQRRKAAAADAAEWTRLRGMLAESIGMAYDVAKGLCPTDLDPELLRPALERLCRETREHHGLACRLQADGEVDIRNPELALHLYRIAREAVANSVKHARCTRITVALARAAGGLALRVTDDGPETVPGAVPAAGLGLGILKHRARLIGGTLHVAGGPDGGMEVVCRVPQTEISA